MIIYDLPYDILLLLKLNIKEYIRFMLTCKALLNVYSNNNIHLFDNKLLELPIISDCLSIESPNIAIMQKFHKQGCNIKEWSKLLMDGYIDKYPQTSTIPAFIRLMASLGYPINKHLLQKVCNRIHTVDHSNMLLWALQGMEISHLDTNINMNEWIHVGPWGESLDFK